MNKLLLAIALSLATGLGVSGCAASGSQSGFGQFDDASITSSVKARLAQDGQLGAQYLKVETRDGVVGLSGFVASETEKIRAAALARNVNGVKEVRNQIIVRPPIF